MKVQVYVTLYDDSGNLLFEADHSQSTRDTLTYHAKRGMFDEAIKESVDTAYALLNQQKDLERQLTEGYGPATYAIDGPGRTWTKEQFADYLRNGSYPK
jgi:hypothetical protein